MAIGLVVTLTIQPDKAADFEAAMREFIPIVKANEPGATVYTLTKAKGAPDNEFVMMEQYASQADLDAHNKTPHFQALVAKIGPMLAGPPKAQTLEVLA
jgi:quinol monooxygenase YgiN